MLCWSISPSLSYLWHETKSRIRKPLERIIPCLRRRKSSDYGNRLIKFPRSQIPSSHRLTGSQLLKPHILQEAINYHNYQNSYWLKALYIRFLCNYFRAHVFQIAFCVLSYIVIDCLALSCSPSLDFLLKAERKYGTFPNWFFSSSCISNCVFTNKLGEVAEDICPGARPVYSFQLCVYELCSCLLPIKSRFYFPLPIFPVPLPPLLFPSSTFPSSSSTCSLPAKPGRTGGFFSSVSLEPPPFYLPLYCTLHPYLSPNTSLFHCTASSYTRQGERFGPRPHGLSPSS